MIFSAQNLPEKKEKIIEYIKKNGPSLPGSISNSVGMPVLFTSAILSEMTHEEKLRMTHLKIGGSPLYLLQEQEALLDNFIKYLEKKEQEALALLKKEQVLEDEAIEPSFSVALRNIKDFAIMIKISTESGDKIFWRDHLLSKEEAEEKIRAILARKPKIKKETKEIKKEGEKVEIKKEEKAIEEPKEIKPAKIEKEKRTSKKKSKIDFFEKARNYFESNNLTIVKEINEDDIIAIVSSPTTLGNLNFLAILKNKKKLNEADITLALHEGQKQKLPILLLTPGSITKKAEKYVEENKGYIVIKNIKF